MSESKLALSIKEMEEIEKILKITDPESEIIIDFIEARANQLKKLVEEYRELKGFPEKIRSLGRKRVMLEIQYINDALNALQENTPCQVRSVLGIKIEKEALRAVFCRATGGTPSSVCGG
jgi:predicted HAD superfamily hydrolase